MQELKIFNFDYVVQLQRKVEIHSEIDDYYLNPFPYEKKYPKGSTGIFLPDDFVLLNSDNSNNYDLENAIKIYEGLSGMNETKASDSRLWTYLTHVTFWEYMQSRWPLNNVKNPSNRILDRYHMKYLKIESLVRNGISRLWWFVHLTIDDNRPDKYALTKILLSKADIVVGLLERTFGSNYNIRTAVLEFLNENPEISNKEDSWRELYKIINLMGGVKNLPFLEKDEIKNNLLNVKYIITS